MANELPAEVKTQISNLAGKNNHNEVFKYINAKLTEGVITADQILYYAERYKFSTKPGKPFVIDASTINKLGVAVSKLSDPDQKKLSIKFYKLAADRDSDWGCDNYAVSILSEDIDSALKYAVKAVELTKESKKEKDRHKWILGRCLLGKERVKKAFIAFAEYFVLKESEYRSTYDQKVKEGIISDIKSIAILRKYIKNKYLDNITDEEDFDEERLQNILEVMDPLINIKGFSSICDDAKEFMAEVFYIKGVCHELRKEYAEAMDAFCNSAFDKKQDCYRDVIRRRARLIKDQVARDLTPDDSEGTPPKRQRTSIRMLLHKGVRFVDKLSSFWSKESEWVHSADARGVSGEYEARLAQINGVIKGRRTEIDLIDELLKEEAEDVGNVTEKKQKLEEELVILEEARESLTKKHAKYNPEKRRVFRRHATEQSFFNPKRSKKHAELIELTHNIIDQRFKLEASDGEELPPPVVLDDVNARRFISAERAFQDAVVKLTSHENPRLGIPKVKEKAWNLDNGHSGKTGYGPVEQYLVSDTELESEHRTSPKRDRLGDSYLPQHGNYSSDIYGFFWKITQEDLEKEKSIAAFLIRYGKTHQTVSLEELQDLYEQATLGDVKKFNQICFLVMEKEQAQWHHAVSESLQVGMAVSQARALIMVRAGFITLEEVFKNNTLFGIYSQTQIVKVPQDVEASCRRIDELYLIFLQNKNLKEHFALLKKHMDKSQMVYVLTREQAHRDLGEVYGGESDTGESDDEYESELSFSK